MGMQDVRLMISGGAPLPARTMEVIVSDSLVLHKLLHTSICFIFFIILILFHFSYPFLFYLNKIRHDIYQFFRVLLGGDCTCHEGYGMTETTGATCVTYPDDLTLGQVGGPFPCCEVE